MASRSRHLHVKVQAYHDKLADGTLTDSTDVELVMIEEESYSAMSLEELAERRARKLIKAKQYRVASVVEHEDHN